MESNMLLENLRAKREKIESIIADQSETGLNFIINRHKWMLCIIMF